ncbi:hypothetical protein ACE1OA_30395 [Streptomyces sp. JL2001]|uniref:hypothetical protein n=1 Tax=Streptomyces sp. JL2001 TaxID=3342488 RepID=UPI003D80998C
MTGFDTAGTLLARARMLTEAGHPDAGAAWRRAAAAVARAGGRLSPGDEADSLDALALDHRGDVGHCAETHFARAAELHERAGSHGKALLSRARALLCAPDAADAAGPGPEARAMAALGALCDQVVAAHEAGDTTAAQTATLLLLQCGVRAGGLGATPGPGGGSATESGATDLRAKLERLRACTQDHRRATAANAGDRTREST